MNTKLLALTATAAAMFIIGCDEKTPAPNAGGVTGAMKDMADKTKETAGKAAEATKDAATKTVDAAKDAAGKAADGLQGLLGGNQEGAVKFFTDNLSGAKATMADWAKKVEALPAPAKAAVEPTWKSLTEKVGAFEKSLGDMKGATGDGWKASAEKLFKDWGDIGGMMDKVKGMMK
ncbi:MAG: hypothetical protein ACT4PL_00075 [Phycisphaerales bacterium]